MMKKILTLLLLSSFALTVLGCTQPSDSGDPSTQVSATPASATPSADKVTVEATGTNFDPAVPKEQLPDEAWACVMGGTVHYATLTKGDGKCARCKMDLHEGVASKTF
jgi:ABC-type transport system substrate-binding protein